MIDKKKETRNIWKIGALIIVALVLFYFGFNFLKGIDLFDSSTRYYVILSNGKDVTKSTPVNIDGYRVGLVRDVKLDYQHLSGITVELALDKDLRLPVGSKIAIKGNPLTGAELVIIKERNPKTYYQENDTIPSISNADVIEQVTEDILPSMQKMIGKMDTLIMGLNRIVNNDHIGRTFTEISQASENIRKASDIIQHTIANDVPTVANNISQATASINDISTRLRNIEIEKTITDFSATVKSLQVISNKLTQKDNSLGLLLNDHQLYDNLKRVSNSADSLLIDLRVNPKRYVTFSLF